MFHVGEFGASRTDYLEIPAKPQLVEVIVPEHQCTRAMRAEVAELFMDRVLAASMSEMYGVVPTVSSVHTVPSVPTVPTVVTTVPTVTTTTTVFVAAAVDDIVTRVEAFLERQAPTAAVVPTHSGPTRPAELDVAAIYLVADVEHRSIALEWISKTEVHRQELADHVAMSAHELERRRRREARNVQCCGCM
jgi:hypothetical protein